MAGATLFDGRSARAWAVSIAYEADGLSVTRDGAQDRVPLALLRREPHTRRLTLLRTDAPDWRLLPDDPPPAGWLDAIARGDRPEPAAVRMVAGWTALAAGVAALLWVQGPALLQAAAPLVPHRVTAPIGQSMVAQLTNGRTCDAPAGRAALDALVERLTPPGGLVEPVTVRVADSGYVNALAGPGGQVLLYHGLIAEAATPEEVAGVLAHELGHVQRRHPTQALLRHFGVSVILQGMGGDAGAFADLALVLARTRDAEREADEQAIVILRAANIATTGLADFFARQQAEDARKRRRSGNAGDDLLERLSSYTRTHPQDADRLALFRAAGKGRATVPALSPAEWRALRGICRARAK